MILQAIRIETKIFPPQIFGVVNQPGMFSLVEKCKLQPSIKQMTQWIKLSSDLKTLLFLIFLKIQSNTFYLYMFDRDSLHIIFVEGLLESWWGLSWAANDKIFPMKNGSEQFGSSGHKIR